MLKFLLEYIFIRFIMGSRGGYKVIIEEWDAEMTAPFCYRYNGKDLCKPYVYEFDNFIDANDFYNREVEHHMVPWHSIAFSYNHRSGKDKIINTIRW